MKKLGGLVLIVFGLIVSALGAASEGALLFGIIILIVGLITTWSAESKK